MKILGVTLLGCKVLGIKRPLACVFDVLFIGQLSLSLGNVSISKLLRVWRYYCTMLWSCAVTEMSVCPSITFAIYVKTANYIYLRSRTRKNMSGED